MKMKIKKMIKIISLIILVLTALAYTGYKYLNWSFNQPCDPPPKPDGMPVSARWYGGCDGGYWLEFVEYQSESNKYRFRVYLDYKTEVLLDADYMLNEECLQASINIPKDSSILDMIGYIEGYYKKLYFDNTEKMKCYLAPVYPAYGGIDWETLKETGEYEKSQD